MVNEQRFILLQIRETIKNFYHWLWHFQTRNVDGANPFPTKEFDHLFKLQPGVH